MSEALDLPIHSDNEVEDVDVEISEEELGGEAIAPEPDPEPEPKPEAAAEEEPEPKKKKPRESARIAELARQREDAERRAEAAEAARQQEADLRRQSDAAMMRHYEISLDAQAKEIKRRIVEARDKGDTEAEVEAQADLSGVLGQINDIKSWKIANPQADAAPIERKAEPKPEPRQEQQASFEPTTASWIKANEWFQPQSPNFDAEMHEEATLYARRIERRYKAEGRGDEIGTGAYFEEIDRHMSEEFPDAFETTPKAERKTPPMKRDASVAPVTRTGVPGEAVKPGRTVRLTADQRKFAHTMASNGAYKNADGSRMNNEQAEKHYAIYLLKQQKG